MVDFESVEDVGVVVVFGKVGDTVVVVIVVGGSVLIYIVVIVVVVVGGVGGVVVVGLYEKYLRKKPVFLFVFIPVLN